MRSSCAAIEGSLDAVVDSTVQGTADQWLEEEVKGVADTVAQFTSSQDSLLREAWLTVEKYVSDEVKKDVPTGMLYNCTPG